MTLDQLHVFVTIARLGSFSAAAKSLHRAQSAISIAVKNLEEEYGVSLFDRGSYRPSLTPAGRMLLKEAEDLLAKEASFHKTARQLGAGRETEIRLAVDAILPFPTIRNVLKEFAAAFPDVSLKLFVENLGGGDDLLATGQTDIALFETTTRSDLFELQPWRNVAFVPVVAPQHPLARLKRAVTEEDTENAIQIVVKSSRRLSEAKDTFISKRSRPWIVADFPTKLALLADGFGWGFMPEHMVRDALQRRVLKHLTLAEEYMRRLFEVPAGAPIDNTVTVYAARRLDLPAGPVATSMWQLFQRLKD